MAFVDFAGVSDRQVLEQLAVLVKSGRRVGAEIVAHLAEVDERRLQLRLGYNSLFSYCLAVHGMSEDEACRRIEVARLGRKFDGIFPLLAAGRLSLSVAALLKKQLTQDDQEELLAAVAHKSVCVAREVLAARFPQPDVPATVRKLPEPRARTSATGQGSGSGEMGKVSISSQVCGEPELERCGEGTRDIAGGAGSIAGGADREKPKLAEGSGASGDAASPSADERRASNGSDWFTVGERAPVASRADRGRAEPISRGRYRIQFTADVAFKEKLELARDLMSHRNPTREFAPILERALELLIDQLLTQREGKAARPRTARRPSSGRLTRETRRTVSARDGHRCTYVGAGGRRCDGQAFLEYDHEWPVGKGGGSETPNVRLSSSQSAHG